MLHADAITIDQIADHTRGLAGIASLADPTTPVPTCGEWTIADLAFHLYEVQRFWVHIIGNRPAGPEEYEHPDVPADIAVALQEINARLVELLAAADPAETAWSWSDNHTVAFTIRRQLHEALVHHADATLAIGLDLPEAAPLVAADGVDELVDVMLTGIPDWATFLPSAEFVRLRCTDTGDQWTMSLGQISGTSSQTGVTYDGLPAADRIADDMRPDLTISGPAFDVLLWLWGRLPSSSLTLTGETEIAARLRDTVTAATQ
jgi:uncharacterized protein (TIGR03083 family)